MVQFFKTYLNDTMTAMAVVAVVVADFVPFGVVAVGSSVFDWTADWIRLEMHMGFV